MRPDARRLAVRRRRLRREERGGRAPQGASLCCMSSLRREERGGSALESAWAQSEPCAHMHGRDLVREFEFKLSVKRLIKLSTGV